MQDRSTRNSGHKILPAATSKVAQFRGKTADLATLPPTSRRAKLLSTWSIAALRHAAQRQPSLYTTPELPIELLRLAVDTSSASVTITASPATQSLLQLSLPHTCSAPRRH